MSQTYLAVLDGNRLEWVGTPPPVESGSPVTVQVTFSGSSDVCFSDAARSRRIAEILEKLAQSNPFRDIEDPVEWQREIRKDRPLPGREP
jgi:hypothetical protein